MPLILLGHGGGQHKAAPGIVSHARGFAAAGFAVVAIDAPNHGDRPKDEEFGRIAAGMRAGLAAGESPGALVAGMHSYLARQAVADWRAVLTAVQCLDQLGVGPAGYLRDVDGLRARHPADRRGASDPCRGAGLVQFSVCWN